MPLPYTATPRVSADALPLPDGAAGNAAHDRAQLDARAFLRDASEALLDWSDELEVLPGGIATAFTIRVGAIARVSLRDTTGASFQRYALAYAGGSIGPSAIEGGGLTLGAVARPWYAYAFRGAGGALDFELSVTAPDAARRYKTGDTTRRYLRSFMTTATGHPLAMLAVGGVCRYRRSAEGAAVDFGSGGLRALAAVTTATGATPTPIDLTARMPPHARVAMLGAQLFVNGAGADATLGLWSADDATAADRELRALGNPASGTLAAELVTTADQRVGYTLSIAAGAASLDVDLLGWRE